MSEHCGTVNENGSAVCIPGQCSCSTETKENKSIQLSIPTIQEEKSMWKKIRSGFMFVVACFASPCCTPIIVPIGLALLAGTPFAVWASAHLGWVYGGLTLLSVVSLLLGIRWMNQKSNTKPGSKSKIISIEKVKQS